jgi:hypothetical protein
MCDLSVAFPRLQWLNFFLGLLICKLCISHQKGVGLHPVSKLFPLTEKPAYGKNNNIFMTLRLICEEIMIQ